MVELLLRSGADVNAKKIGSGVTPLHVAFRNGDRSLAKMLLRFGGNLLAQDAEGNTPVHYAIRYCSTSRSECESNTSSYSRLSGGSRADDDWKAIEGRTDYIAALEVRNKKGLRPKELLDIGLQQVVEKLAFAFFERKPAVKPLNSHRENYNTATTGGQAKKKLRARKLRKTATGTSKYRLHLGHQQTSPEPAYMCSATTEMGSEDLSEEISSARCGSVASEEVKDSGKQGLETYEAIKLLGKGSFGEVYLVRHKDSRELCAMKVIQKAKIMSQNIVRYVITEKRVMSQTNHPFIVKLRYAFQTKERLFLVMDYCPGGDLSQYLAKEKRFSEDRARVYLCEIILAIEDLHKRNIIFRYYHAYDVLLAILSQTTWSSTGTDTPC